MEPASVRPRSQVGLGPSRPRPPVVLAPASSKSARPGTSSKSAFPRHHPSRPRPPVGLAPTSSKSASPRHIIQVGLGLQSASPRHHPSRPHPGIIQVGFGLVRPQPRLLHSAKTSRLGPVPLGQELLPQPRTCSPRPRHQAPEPPSASYGPDLGTTSTRCWPLPSAAASEQLPLGVGPFLRPQPRTSAPASDGLELQTATAPSRPRSPDGLGLLSASASDGLDLQTATAPSRPRSLDGLGPLSALASNFGLSRLGPGVPSALDLVSCCLELPDSHVVHQPSVATTWSTISCNNRPSQARRGHVWQAP